MKATSGASARCVVAAARVSAVHWVLPVTSDSIGLTRIGSDKSGIGCAVCIGARQCGVSVALSSRCAAVRCIWLYRLDRN